MDSEVRRQQAFNLCVDQGNTAIKIAVFDGNKIVDLCKVDFLAFEKEVARLSSQYPVENCIFSTVARPDTRINNLLKESFSRFIFLSHQTPIPIINAYTSPETLGRDRLAAVVGANKMFPHKNILVIDAGTAITYDFICDQGIYKGGNIAPGIDMRLKALNQFTQKLPLIEPRIDTDFLGNDTSTAILSGVIYGVLFEIEGYVSKLKEIYSDLEVILTGGSALYIEEKVNPSVHIDENLVLIGLNYILEHNVHK